MNFLLHAFLAGDHPSLVVGGVMGDWIKGPLPARLPADLARGVALHRSIDSFSEGHAAFRASRARVAAARRRYAGVLVDMFYDHLLARDWQRYHSMQLADFSRRVYRMIDERLSDIPQGAHAGLLMMAQEDWLASYATVEGIAGVLVRMARRARQPNPLAGGENEFEADPDGYAVDFSTWLTDARQFVDRWCAANE